MRRGLTEHHQDSDKNEAAHVFPASSWVHCL